MYSRHGHFRVAYVDYSVASFCSAKLGGECAEARRYLTDALEIFERLGTLLEPDKVRKELAELPD